MKYPKMLRDNLLIRMEVERKTRIELPIDVEQEKKIASSVGTVVAVGPDVKQCKKGDFVWIKPFIGNIIPSEEFGSEIVSVVNEVDILAIK